MLLKIQKKNIIHIIWKMIIKIKMSKQKFALQKKVQILKKIYMIPLKRKQALKTLKIKIA